ncbi:MAG: SRPBCC family protein [Bacteroidota bacterium]
MTTIIIIVCILAIPFVLALFQSNAYVISRNITINKSKEEVFDYIRHIKNMDHYNKWVMTDPGQKTTFTGVDGETGFIYAWDSQNKQAGKGEQEIKQIDPNNKIVLEVRFEKPFKGVSETYMTTETTGLNQTKVTSVFTGNKNYGMKLAHMLLNLEKVLGKDLDKTLQNLKQILEK